MASPLSSLPSSPPPADAALIDPTAERLSVTCPRCHETVLVRFYGPCDVCRTTMRAALGSAAHDVEVAGYEPKMNVTPNAVALKD
jgi:hypothetical protein